jgi:hypothetical protein
MSLFTFWLVSSHLHQAVNLPAEEHDAVAADAVAYIVRAKRNAPAHVRMGLAALELAFGGLLCTLWIGAAPNSRRGRALLRFFGALPGPAPNLLRFYASLTALYAYEHPAVIRRLGLPHMDERQVAMRMIRSRIVVEQP